MSPRVSLALPLAAAIVLASLPPSPADACCPAGRIRPGDVKGSLPVVNADQSVIIVWDAATKMQHFIRKASFKSEGDDFGFLVPSPTQPKLAESGNDAFPALYDLTKPEVIEKKAPAGGGGCTIGCSDPPKSARGGGVRVLDQVPNVAGYQAAVLEAGSPKALTAWLASNGYAFSPEVEAWAKPYIDQGWIITAFKVAKGDGAKDDKGIHGAALRMTFQTEKPLFPYREPDFKGAEKELGSPSRLLRIYFLAEARYRGELTEASPWTGRAVWSGKVPPAARAKTLGQLKLPPDSGPESWWLTEFEDPWPYRVAPADVTFSRDPDQATIKRDLVIRYVSAGFSLDVTMIALAVAMALPILRRGRKGEAGPMS